MNDVVLGINGGNFLKTQCMYYDVTTRHCGAQQYDISNIVILFLDVEVPSSIACIQGEHATCNVTIFRYL